MDTLLDYHWTKQRQTFTHPGRSGGRKFYYLWSWNHQGWRAEVCRGSGSAGPDCFIWSLYDNKGRNWARGSHKKGHVCRRLAEKMLAACLTEQNNLKAEDRS